MERASLHPVPSQPDGPAAPAEAVHYVTEELPGLDHAAAAAFAMVTLVGRPRPEVGGSFDSGAAVGLSGEALGDALARARKALRRKLYPLPGSGWCERAERLISDRLDQALEDPGPARLEVHLANCTRCVEHERRLGQAQDALVAGFAPASEVKERGSEGSPPAPEAELLLPPVLRALPPPPSLEALPAPPPPEPLPPADSEPHRLPPADPGPEPLPPADPEPELLPAADPEPLADSQQPSQTEPPLPSTVPSARRLASSSLWTPAALSPPRTPPAGSPPPVPLVASAAPTVPATPATVSTPPPWHGDPPRPALAGRLALETERTWTAIRPFAAVIFVAVMAALLVRLLARDS